MMIVVLEISKQEKKIEVLKAIQEVDLRIEGHKKYALLEFKAYGSWGWHSQREKVNLAIKERLIKRYSNL